MIPTITPLRLSVLFVSLLIYSGSQAQRTACDNPTGFSMLHANNVHAQINCSGSQFWDGSDAGYRLTNYAGSPATIFAQGLWIAGFDPGGNLKMAAAQYGMAQGNFDFYPGPLSAGDLNYPGGPLADPFRGTVAAETCSDWDRVWSVYRYEIEAHQADYADNGVIDNLQISILGWPGQGNSEFSSIYGFELPDTPAGLAPFWDADADGIYEPLDGEYPQVEQSVQVPEQITWCVFNDQGNIHAESNGSTILQMEIQLTNWAFDCIDNVDLKNTVFSSYKLINRAIERVDSLRLGLWLDFDLGCYTDDYVGSAPNLNTFFAYNQSNIDDVCQNNVAHFGENPPVQSVTVLNQELSSFMVFNGFTFDGPLATYGPETPNEYYNYLNSRFRDGTPLSEGGSGYDPTGMNPPATHAFPGDPNDDTQWSEYAETLPFVDQRSVGGVFLDKLLPDEIVTVDFAHAFFREAGNNNIENVTTMYQGVEDTQLAYDMEFTASCISPPICEDDCIWAGDTNADGIANHCDLLPIGLAYETAGELRPGPYNWTPQDGLPWPGTQWNGANSKHIDAQGNGTINAEDFMVTLNHYRLTRPDYVASDVYPEGDELGISPSGSAAFNMLEPGDFFFATLKLEENIPDLAGLAFTVEYDPTYFEYIKPLSDTEDEPTQADDYLECRLSVVSGELDYARVRINTTDPIVSGTLTPLRVQVRDAFPNPLPTATSLIRFKNAKGVLSDGTEFPIGGADIEATVLGITVGTEEPRWAEAIQLFPNPARERFELRAGSVEIEEVSLFHASGQLAWQSDQAFSGNRTIELEQLPAGLYQVRIRKGSDLIIRKLVKM